MEYRRLANSDIDVSIVAFGCWAIVGGFNWGPQDEDDSIAALRAAHAAGINFFDTAEGYGDGASERLLAKALSGVRDEIVIATKVSPRHFAPAELRAACERSLHNLNTTWIDLYQLHWPNPNIPIDETISLLEKLRSEGKIRTYGVSNFGEEDLNECLATGNTISSNQLAYNLLFRAIEYEILPRCLREGISVLCYSPLMQGLLTGKFGSADEVPEDRARTRHYASGRPQARHNEAGAEAEMFAAIDRIRQIAEQLGKSMAHISLAWLLAQKGVTSVVTGARNADQAKGNATATELRLTGDVIEQLSKMTEPLKRKLGRNADMWQSRSRMH